MILGPPPGQVKHLGGSHRPLVVGARTLLTYFQSLKIVRVRDER
jgi:hypothetical protein